MFDCTCKEKPVSGLRHGVHVRHRLFNRVTIVLITVWVLLVGVIAAISEQTAPAAPNDVRAFIEQLL